MSNIVTHDYVCEHFIIEELVSQKVFEERGERAWQLLDPRGLITLDRLRKRYGRMTINDWKWGGKNESRGLRTQDSPWYRQFSQHSFGRGFDAIFSDTDNPITAEEVRIDIQENKDHPDFEFIMSIELEVSWLHFDVRNCERIFAFRP